MANKHEIDIQPIAIDMINGDINSKNIIVDYYTKYIFQLVETKFNNHNIDKNILIESGKIGLYKAINSYTIENKKYFSNYVTTTIIQHINGTYIKETNKLQYKNRNIQKLAEEMSKGNVEAKDKIIEFYSYHIKNIVENEYEYINCEKEDLIQAGLIGLLNAINHYLVGKPNHPFSVYANTYIHKHIKKEIKLYNKELTINYTFDSLGDIFIDYIDIKITTENLSKLQKEILYLHIFYNYSFDEIAIKYNFTFQNAHTHYKNALKIIKKELLNEKCKSK